MFLRREMVVSERLNWQGTEGRMLGVAMGGLTKCGRLRVEWVLE